jgi:hypothetical protein
MSDIGRVKGNNLQDYVNRAQESQDGVIRERSQGDGQLINKGSLGQRVVTWMQNLFGQNKDVAPQYKDTRNSVEMRPLNEPPRDPMTARQEDIGHRNLQALEGFRQALTDRYGEDVAQRALSQTGMENITSLTGRSVMLVVEKAQTLEENAPLFPIPPGSDPDRLKGDQARKLFDDFVSNTPRTMPSGIEPRDVLMGRSERTGEIDRQVKQIAGDMKIAPGLTVGKGTTIGERLREFVLDESRRQDLPTGDVVAGLIKELGNHGNMHPLVALAILDELDKIK